jgi:hypothetical protein
MNGALYGVEATTRFSQEQTVARKAAIALRCWWKDAEGDEGG